MNPASIWTPQVLDDEGVCAVCKETTKNRCTACKTVYYCSADHQKLHWKSDHKKNCGIIELVEDPQIGQHYIAKRRIERGEVVLREKAPLVIFVSATDDLICLNCYTDLRSKKKKICNKCQWWPLCSDCTQHGAECEFTVKYGKFKDLPDKGKSTRKKWIDQNLITGVIRMLALRETNPKAYSKFLKHEDHFESMKMLYGDTLDIRVVKLVREFFNVEHVEEAEMAKIQRILMISSFGDRDECSYFAEKTSYLEHNCRPNCSKTLPDKDGSFLVWAVETIETGEHVSICYNNVDVGTMKRKDWLLSTKFFDCNCRRCEDPTEFGTMFNAVKCPKTRCNGDMLPATFTMSEGKYPDFVCCKCKTSLPSKLVEIMQRRVGEKLSAIQNEDVYAYKCFIENHAEILHKNHFYMIDAKLKLADVLGFDAYSDSDLTNVPNNLLNEKIQLSEEVDEVFKLIMPANTRFRGRLLYGIAIALSKQCDRESNNMPEFVVLLKKGKQSLTESCKLLCYEAQHTEEGQMAREAMKSLQKLERLNIIIQ